MSIAPLTRIILNDIPNGFSEIGNFHKLFPYCLVFPRRQSHERGHQGVRELRGQRDTTVAEGRHGTSPVQRVRPVQQDQRSESAAGQVGPKENYSGN